MPVTRSESQKKELGKDVGDILTQLLANPTPHTTNDISSIVTTTLDSGEPNDLKQSVLRLVTIALNARGPSDLKQALFELVSTELDARDAAPTTIQEALTRYLHNSIALDNTQALTLFDALVELSHYAIGQTREGKAAIVGALTSEEGIAAIRTALIENIALQTDEAVLETISLATVKTIETNEDVKETIKAGVVHVVKTDEAVQKAIVSITPKKGFLFYVRISIDVIRIPLDIFFLAVLLLWIYYGSIAIKEDGSAIVFETLNLTSWE